MLFVKAKKGNTVTQKGKQTNLLDTNSIIKFLQHIQLRSKTHKSMTRLKLNTLRHLHKRIRNSYRVQRRLELELGFLK